MTTGFAVIASVLKGSKRKAEASPPAPGFFATLRMTVARRCPG
jgi:hypothetical protein